MRGTTVITGVGQTASGNLVGSTPVSLCTEAISEALKDSQISIDMVDGLFAKIPTSQPGPIFAQQIAEAIGICPLVGVSVDQAGASMAAMVGMATMAIAAKQCEIAVVVMGDTPRSGYNPYGQDLKGGSTYGWSGITGGYAMVARRHMELWGTSAEHLGSIATTIRSHGAANPRAQLRKPIDMASYFKSPMIVDPLRRDDCCLISDAGAAVIVMSAERARALGMNKVTRILGFGQGHTSSRLELRPELTATMAAKSAGTAFEMAKMRPKDIDVAQIYDCFTITVLMTLESYGFCAEGEGGPFCLSGNIDLDGSIPINTSGGLLAESGMPGGQLIIEAVRQLRDEATTQVPGAETALISGQGGVMHTHATLVLGN